MWTHFTTTFRAWLTSKPLILGLLHYIQLHHVSCMLAWFVITSSLSVHDFVWPIWLIKIYWFVQTDMYLASYVVQLKNGWLDQSTLSWSMCTQHSTLLHSGDIHTTSLITLTPHHSTVYIRTWLHSRPQWRCPTEPVLPLHPITSTAADVKGSPERKLQGFCVLRHMYAAITVCTALPVCCCVFIRYAYGCCVNSGWLLGTWGMS